jgi:AraC-like DNA-binding protein
MYGGELDCRYGPRRHSVLPGDLMLVNPGEVHDGRPASSAGRAYSMLEIDFGPFRRLCAESIGVDNFEFEESVLRQSHVRNALSLWLQRLQGVDVRDERDAASTFIGRLSELTGRFPIRTLDRGLATEVARQLLEDCEGIDRIGDLSTRLGVSRFQLIRAFKDRYGLTPEDYRRQLRVERARALMRSPRTLADIAFSAGFADQSHMTREFRRLTGLSPGAYRQAIS